MDGNADSEGAVSDAGSWKALDNEPGRRCLSLLYHHVGGACPGTYPDLTVSPERFERHVRWLARNGYKGIRPSDWLGGIRDEKTLPAKPVLVTFDDAYADTAEYALPILKKYGFGATVFAVTGLLGGTNAWDEARGSGTHRLMNAEQIRYWAANGIEFGAHGRMHADLTVLSADELANEVQGSKADLEALLGAPVTSFAYPYGSHNDQVIEAVRASYDLAFSCTEGINTIHTDPHLLRRAYVGPGDSLFTLRLIACRGGIEGIRQWRIRLALRTRLRRLFGL